MLGVQAFGPISPRRVAEGEPTGSPSVDSVARFGAEGIVAPVGGFQPAAGSDAHATAERDAWVTLLAVPGLGPVTFSALLDALGSARTVLEVASSEMGPERLRSAMTRFGLSLDLAAHICEGVADGDRAVERVRSLGLTVVTLEEPTYPNRLRLVDMPPPILFVRGSVAAMEGEHAVAIVGTRWPTDKGRLIAAWIGSAVARAGAVVVSGLAVGIDGAAHAAVVAEQRPTVAVLGGGHAHLFPRAHARLADAIVEVGGAVVSELLPDTSPSRGAFPRRNRLVSGLSDATVVVEAGRRSGALITAGWALEQGRDCFLVPGPFDAPTSAGCHAFLRSFPGQARLVSGVAELLEDLELDAGTDAPASIRPVPGQPDGRRHDPQSSVSGAGRAAVLVSLAPVERALAELLVEGPASADDLSRRTSLGVAAILSALTLLELRGLVASAGGRYVPTGALAAWSGAPARRRKQGQ
jgi:DNA processing protein